MYQLKSEKAIKFYEKNKGLDFDKMNELFVDILGNIIGSMDTAISENVLRKELSNINARLDVFNSTNNSFKENVEKEFLALRTNATLINTLVENNKQLYLAEMKNLFDRRDSDSIEKIKDGVIKANGTLFKQTMDEIPKGNDIVLRELESQKKVFELETKRICDIIHTSNDFRTISQELDLKYEKMQSRISESMQGMLGVANGNMMEKMMEHGHSITSVHDMFKEYLEKQKNSTLKGKESEIKLEILLNSLYSHGKVCNNTGEAQSGDYLLEREGKVGILFENKDYNTNVPDVEIKKFIRDIENKKTHGIILSQRSGIQNKGNFHIDIHMGYVIVYVHNVNYDGSKIKMAVQMIDHLVPQLRKLNETQESSVSLELMAEINKEYLCFIGQKKQLLEYVRKFNKDMSKQIEDIEMPKLTCLLNGKFTNVDQLEFKCDICNNYTARNHRALVTHKNSCRKKLNQTNEVIVINNDV